MLFKRFVCLLTVLLLLFADSGQMLYARTCLKTGQLSFSFTQPDNCNHTTEHACCARKHRNHQSSSVSKAPCCAVAQTLIKQAISGSYAPQYNETAPKAVVTTISFVLAPVIVAYTLPLQQAQAPPPTRYSADFTGVFRI